MAHADTPERPGITKGPADVERRTAQTLHGHPGHATPEALDTLLAAREQRVTTRAGMADVIRQWHEENDARMTAVEQAEAEQAEETAESRRLVTAHGHAAAADDERRTRRAHPSPGEVRRNGLSRPRPASRPRTKADEAPMTGGRALDALLALGREARTPGARDTVTEAARYLAPVAVGTAPRPTATKAHRPTATKAQGPSSTRGPVTPASVEALITKALDGLDARQRAESAALRAELAAARRITEQATPPVRIMTKRGPAVARTAGQENRK